MLMAGQLSNSLDLMCQSECNGQASGSDGWLIGDESAATLPFVRSRERPPFDSETPRTENDDMREGGLDRFTPCNESLIYQSSGEGNSCDVFFSGRCDRDYDQTLRSAEGQQVRPPQTNLNNERNRGSCLKRKNPSGNHQVDSGTRKHALVSQRTLLMKSEKDIISMMVNSRLEIAKTTDEHGYLPLHHACYSCPDNERLVSIILSANTAAARICVQRLAEKEALSKGENELCSDGRLSKRGKFLTSFNIRRKESPCLPRPGSYPLHIALENEAPYEVIQLLVREAPQVLLLTDASGLTPLSTALKRRSDEQIVNFLMSEERGAATLPDKQLNLPLHYACTKGYSLQVVKNLVNVNPAAIHFKNFNGNTPLDLSQSHSSCKETVNEYLDEIAFFKQDVEEVEDV